MTPTQRKAMEQAALAIFPAMPYGRIGTKDIQQQALQLAYAGLIAALAEPAPEPTSIDRRIAAIAADRDYWREQANGSAPVREPAPVPLLTADEKLQIALDCNMRVRTGSGAIKFATAIEALVRQKAGL